MRGSHDDGHQRGFCRRPGEKREVNHRLDRVSDHMDCIAYYADNFHRLTLVVPFNFYMLAKRALAGKTLLGQHLADDHIVRAVQPVLRGKDPPFEQRYLNGIERSEEHTSELQSR